MTRAVTALAIVGMVSTCFGLLVLPLVILLPVDDTATTGITAFARVGVITLLVCVAIALLTLRTERPVKLVARTVHATIRRLPGCHPPADLSERIVAERDAVGEVLRRRKGFVAVTALGHAFSDYFALYASLLAVGLRPSPMVVLVAFIAANTAGMIPFTPGGVGFVEAGVGGALVLMGMAQTESLAAVAIYRLVSCWLPVLAGVVAYVVSRRSATVAPVMRTSSSPVVENTCLGVPAAAQTVP